MNITLKLTPQAEAELVRRATVSGLDAQTHAASILEESLNTSCASHLQGETTFGKRLVDTFAMIRGLADDIEIRRDSSHGRSIDLS